MPLDLLSLDFYEPLDYFVSLLIIFVSLLIIFVSLLIILNAFLNF